MGPIKQDYDARLQSISTPALSLAKAAQQTLPSVLPRDKPLLNLRCRTVEHCSYTCRVLAVVNTLIEFPATTTKIGVLGEDAVVAAASAVQGIACGFGLHLLTCAFNHLPIHHTHAISRLFVIGSEETRRANSTAHSHYGGSSPGAASTPKAKHRCERPHFTIRRSSTDAATE